jgi:hypothetical protein
MNADFQLNRCPQGSNQARAKWVVQQIARQNFPIKLASKE